MFIEMSRDADHGGTGWEFAKCLWAPTQKERGGGWPFWTKVGQVRSGEIVLHLRGKQPKAQFVGFSITSGDGYKTSERPPILGQWNFSQEFFRADLTEYTAFPAPISLTSVFSSRKEDLSRYFNVNRARSGSDKKNIFYVIQSGRLRCLNGAYLSDLDDELAEIIFGPDFSGKNIPRPENISVETGHKIQLIFSRIGQGKFSEMVKSNYGSKCCFPGCPVNDPRFLVGAHIARWTDRHDLRGRADNGLCLCLMHDRAFEAGYFTLDDQFQVTSVKKREDSEWWSREILPYHGVKIAKGEVQPAVEALKEHWTRHGFTA